MCVYDCMHMHISEPVYTVYTCPGTTCACAIPSHYTKRLFTNFHYNLKLSPLSAQLRSFAPPTRHFSLHKLLVAGFQMKLLFPARKKASCSSHIQDTVLSGRVFLFVQFLLRSTSSSSTFDLLSSPVFLLLFYSLMGKFTPFPSAYRLMDISISACLLRLLCTFEVPLICVLLYIKCTCIYNSYI